MIELFQRRVGEVSLDEPESLAEAVAELRQRMEELGFSTDTIADTLIEAVIRFGHRLRSTPHRGQERQTHGLGPNEATDEEGKSA